MDSLECALAVVFYVLWIIWSTFPVVSDWIFREREREEVCYFCKHLAMVNSLVIFKENRTFITDQNCNCIGYAESYASIIYWLKITYDTH